MTVHYELNCGQYVMHRDGRPVLRPLDEVAIAYAIDSERGLADGVVLHKHGTPEKVREWAAVSGASLMQQGALGQSMANEIHVIQGKFDLDALNNFLEGAQRDFLNRYIAPVHGNVLDVTAVEVLDAPQGETESPATPKAKTPIRFR